MLTQDQRVQSAPGEFAIRHVRIVSPYYSSGLISGKKLILINPNTNATAGSRIRANSELSISYSFRLSDNHDTTSL